MATTTLSFPRQSAVGWTDNGKTISDPSEKCPKCGSSSYRQTVSTEDCPDCGLHCDYWGAGANDIYKSMMEQHWAEQERQYEAQRVQDEDYTW